MTAAVQIKLTAFELMAASQAGTMRQLTALRDRREGDDYGAPPGGHLDAHIQGCAAEIAVAKYLGRFWEATIGKIDRGDVGRIEVRSTKHGNGHLIIHDHDVDDAPFVLVTGEAPDLTIAGWIRGRDAKQERWLRQPEGQRRAHYWVPQEDLLPIAELEDATQDATI